MLIQFFGHTQNYFNDAFFSSGSGGFDFNVSNATATSFVAENTDTGFKTTFTGTGFPSDPKATQTGTVTGYSTVTALNQPVMTVTGISWSLQNTLLAFSDFVNGTGVLRLISLYSLQDITFDGSAASESFSQTFFGVTSKISFIGSDFNDSMEGGLDDDVLSGGAGNDTIKGDDGRDTITGGDGNDLIDSSGGIAASQGGGDVIMPGRGSNTIIGHADAFGQGNGGGIDLSYADVTGSGGLTITVVTNGTGSAVSTVGGIVNDTFTFVDRFQGTAQADLFLGSAAGVEIWTGGAGNDTINGRDGQDIVSYGEETGGGAVTVDIGAQTATDTHGDTDTLLNVEGASGTALADVMMGALGTGEAFYGEGGNDTLFGASGDDTLDGGSGADLLNGGPGSDVIYVDDAGDRVSESRKWAGTDTVISSVDFRMGTKHIENLTLREGAVLGAGNGLANLIVGGDANNILDGGKGNDLLLGGGGNDTYLIRGPGDSALEQADEGIDTVKAFRSYALENNVERLFMQNVFTKDGNPANLNGIGNGLDNTIIGTPYANTLIGREGSDVLKGQGGDDTFVFDRALGPNNVDRIIDFEVNGDNDTLKVKGSILGGAVGTGVLNAADFAMGMAAADASDRFIFDQASGQLWFDADGTGAGAQVLMATFEQNAVVQADDILVF